MDEVQDVRGLAARDAGRHIDQRQPPHQVRPLLAQHDSRQPTKAHAHDDGGRGREGVDGVCSVGRRGDRVRAPGLRGRGRLLLARLREARIVNPSLYTYKASRVASAR